jgi:hypothetical protein
MQVLVLIKALAGFIANVDKPTVLTPLSKERWIDRSKDR